jgi:DNA-binding NtrC family response regulator
MTVRKPIVLFVDDEPMVLDTLGQLAARAGFAVTRAASSTDAILMSRQQPPDIALVDLRMPGLGGLDVLRAIRAGDPGCQVILMTGHATVETAIQALKIGARDYLGKPLDLRRVERLLADVKMEVENRHRASEEQQTRLRDCFGMIGNSVPMQHVFTAIRRLAPFIRTALITGETGTGKELVARALHQAGRRAEKRFVTINCSAVVETLFESELFGHVRGAFTGANETKPGLFEVADQGVLFLDEIGELPLSVQAKLLRVLESGDVQRVGSLETRQVDVQIIAATNRDLVVEVAEGRFRSDLYYRLNIVEIRLPPLRARREDIPTLTRAFMLDCAKRWSKPLVGLTPSAQEILVQAPWEGNVRELRNVIERACLLADTQELSDRDVQQALPPETDAASQPASVYYARAAMLGTRSFAVSHDDVSPLSTVERQHIVRALEHSRGNKKAAARVLGVSRRALYRRLERLGLESTIVRRPSQPSPSHPAVDPMVSLP